MRYDACHSVRSLTGKELGAIHMMIRIIGLIFAVVLALPATAAERIALVVGMARYDHIPTLKNTVNDARGVAGALETIGFRVTTLIDAPLGEFRRTLDQFAFQAETAELALIYFAGHGVVREGENFLVPVDAEVRSNQDVKDKSVSLTDLLLAVDKARKMRIVILDSCRDDPFGDEISQDDARGFNSAAGQGGMAPPSPERGTLVAFAARDGEVALDGQGDNSPFATALMQNMPKQGLEISLMFRQVRDQVLAATGNQQEPNTYGSLSGVPFYLAGAGPQEALPEDPVAAWASMPADQEELLLALAEQGDTRSMLGLARMRLDQTLSSRFDPTGAVEWLTRAAEAGSPEAQFDLAQLYEKGLGVPVDPARALALYQEAADQNYARAINDMGFFLYQGSFGLDRDVEKALQYFEKAADLRHPEAMYNFAALIDDGLIATKGPEDAAEYLYLALRSGSKDVLDVLLDRPTMFKPETRRFLQSKLKEYDFYEGSIDGDIGPGTKRGIRRAFGLTE